MESVYGKIKTLETNFSLKLLNFTFSISIFEEVL